MLRKIVLVCLLAWAVLPLNHSPAFAGKDGSQKTAAVMPGDYILLTVFLKHDQSRTLEEINRQLSETGFWSRFPPQGIEVESWYVMMGIGQVVTLRVPPARLREVNLAIEKHAWGAFRSEFYPTYDFREIAERLRAEALQVE